MIIKFFKFLRLVCMKGEHLMSEEAIRLQILLKSANGKQSDVETAIIAEQYLGIRAEDVVKSLRYIEAGTRERAFA